MRQAQLESKYSKYQFSTIRFHFPHRVVVQAKFKPYETVYSLPSLSRVNSKMNLLHFISTLHLLKRYLMTWL
ncbi:hypothetical protein EB796_008569 [Bugula neritina]|uniref:Uncharacterized protein n=1 Tax=Bugula neritina TaxID=10212 RepID=A0A7J7K3E6_BUGNE|nr:hypothetical protein EB796_008569 [Bugula neritina]